MEYQLYKNIVSNPEVCGGRPTIRGTRITVKTVIQHVLAGDNDETLLESFPRLTKESLQDCKEFTTLLFDNPALINCFEYKEDDEFLRLLLQKIK